jgi:hypothetical protein
MSVGAALLLILVAFAAGIVVSVAVASGFIWLFDKMWKP